MTHSKHDVLDCAHFVVDIETLDTADTAVILSIACVAVDSAKSHAWRLDPERQPDRTVSASPVVWWMKQSEEARIIAFGGSARLYPTLQALDDEISRARLPVMVWFRGSMDERVLVNAYAQSYDEPVPWDYWMVRDVRTIADLVKVERSPDHTPHTALGDALHDARIVRGWLDLVNTVRTREADDARG